jgi:hypothetical protein
MRYLNSGSTSLYEPESIRKHVATYWGRGDALGSSLSIDLFRFPKVIMPAPERDPEPWQGLHGAEAQLAYAALAKPSFTSFS